MEEPLLLTEQEHYESPYLVITRAVKRMPTGENATFYLRREADVAVCLPLTQDGRFIMVEEYRHGPGRWMFEIPAGNVDSGEDVSIAAAREALEETGYSGQITHLYSTWISAYSSARKHIYLMRDARKVAEPNMAASDLFRVAELTRTQFEAVVRSGELTDLDAGLAYIDQINRDLQGL
ncbi:NUDIX hydrolase [Acidovorax sp. RAC01]|uniref:NUDIX hydrolase n=1 Tax=Acidovorax sp. RAC01 TaxID=1842533 RepID=UPI0018D39F6D|nr:NUDIX hydrolase [Acidovorax sp. RAC01]